MAAYKLSEPLFHGGVALPTASCLPANSKGPLYFNNSNSKKEAVTRSSICPLTEQNCTTHSHISRLYACVRGVQPVNSWCACVVRPANCRYVINPARHQKHSVVTRNELLLWKNTNLPEASPISTGIDLLFHANGVRHVTSSQRFKDHMSSLFLMEGQGSLTSCKATLPPELPHQDSEMPTPAQLSVILLKLREELPEFFSGYHSYNMYRPDLVFTNNLLPFTWTLYSRWGYCGFLSVSRILLRLTYARLNLDLLRITKDVDTGKIKARWSLRGKPRLRLREKVILDGYSEFRVSPTGLISHHHMDCMMPVQKKRSKIRSVLERPLNLLPKQHSL